MDGGGDEDEGVGWEEGRQIARRYALERRLGGGTTGEVWLAQDMLLRKPVALKVLRPELSRSRETVRRFLREVALAHSVTHPNVVRIYDTGEEDGLPFFTMEYLQGQTLEELLESHGQHGTDPLSFEEVREIALDVLDAMRAAHRVGVVHRDLKPGNVMLTHRGSIVMDFGVAGVEEIPEAPNAAAVRSLVRTEAGTIFGSPAYMAPELWEGSPATVRSDLYAFAVMLYQMLTGRLPYEAKTPAAYLQQLTAGPPPGLRTLRRHVPWSMVRLIRRCMAREPDDRPASAAAAANLVSPLRGTTRQRVAVVAAVLTVGAIVGALARAQPSWRAHALPDAVAAADLDAAVRTFDAGDEAASLRALDRLARHAPDSATVGFWRATVAATLGQETKRLEACAHDPWKGHPRYVALADAACEPTYRLADDVLELLTEDPDVGGTLGTLFPLAVTHDLVPRVEATFGDDALKDEALGVLRRLEQGPDRAAEWALPVRWELARIDLELALGRSADATEHLAELAEAQPNTPLVVRHAAWLALRTGDLDLATTHAEAIRFVDPAPWFELRLREGRLEETRRMLGNGIAPAHIEGIRVLWCGYAWRFGVTPRPAECETLPPSLAGALWAPADAPPAPLPDALQDRIAEAQRNQSLGACGDIETGAALVTHAPSPFETRHAELAVEASLCPADEGNADLHRAHTLVGKLAGAVPSSPFVALLAARVDEARRQHDQARTRRLSVAETWQHADPDLPAVTALREKLGDADPAKTARVP